ncbi:MAG: CCA tRNA nucleotidyltransferase [Clostridia bacterium]|nr:CCA tRNA nucleotidyltransferase [Clostridia bacterium]
MITDVGAEFIINRLEERGFSAFYVGGCVRNAIMQKQIEDYDIATNALPEHVCEIFKDCKIFTPGISHGTVCILYKSLIYEVTTFRKESEYSDYRHPNSVTFCVDIISDLSRRDFTINAMAFNKTTGLIDNFGGFYDAQNKILRAVNNPYLRFEEDALRILRGLRFASVYQLKIESATAKAMLEKAHLLCNISAERIFNELSKLITGANCASILANYFSLFTTIVPELANVSQTEALFKLLSNCSDDLLERFTCLFIFSKEEFPLIAKRLKFPNDLTKKISAIFNLLQNKLPIDKVSIKKILTTNDDCFLHYLNVESTLALTFNNAKKIDLCKQLYILYNEIVENNECYTLKHLAINGKDLKAMGFSGKNIGKALQFLLDSVIEEKVKNDKNNLQDYLKKNYG